MTDRNELHRQKNKKKIYIGIIIAAAIAIIIAGFFIWQNFFDKKQQAENKYKDIQKVVIEEHEDPYQSEINFEELWKQNPDAYAWIRIPGTQVDYPVLQSDEDRNYYLDHTIDGTEGLPGSIYTEGPSSKTFDENNVIIYGHNMRNGTMFGELIKYNDKSFMTQNPYVYLYLPDRTLKYQLFASVVYSNEYLPKKYDFVNQDSYQAFINEIINIKGKDSYVDKAIEVTPDDKVITLSTCIGDQPDNRHLILAVKVKEGE